MSELIHILIKTKRGGEVFCPCCGERNYFTPTELGKFKGICLGCRPTPKRRNRSAKGLAEAKLDLPSVCWLCGVTERLHVHHKDRNPSNNLRDNLVVLCESCHCSVHFNEPVFRIMVRRCLK